MKILKFVKVRKNNVISLKSPLGMDVNSVNNENSKICVNSEKKSNFEKICFAEQSDDPRGKDVLVQRGYQLSESYQQDSQR